MRKGCLVAIVLLLVIGGGVAYLAFGLTKAVADASDEFLALLGEGKVHEAYAATGQALRDQQSEQEFATVVEALGLKGYSSSSWSHRSVENDQGQVKGTITTKSGASIPIEISLIMENSAWKVIGFTGTQATGKVKAGQKPVPDMSVLTKLTTAALLEFNAAVQANDFGNFHKGLSTPFKQKFTPEALAKSFQAFVDQKINIGGIETITPVFDAVPGFNDEGALVVTGYYPTQPSQVHFDLKFVYEHPAWKLLGINVQVK